MDACLELVCEVVGYSETRHSVPDHESPKGMGGAWRNDYPSNVRAVRAECKGDPVVAALNARSGEKELRRIVQDNPEDRELAKIMFPWLKL